MIYYREKPEGLVKKEETAFARALLLDALQEEYGIHTLPVIYKAENGKPFFPEHPDIFFNYSHTDHLVACGLGRQEIGVDVERVRPVRNSLMRRVCQEEEYIWITQQEDPSKAMIMLWTMKEAFTKHSGKGIFSDIKNLNFSALLQSGGKGTFEGLYVQTTKIQDSYLSYCSSEEMLLKKL